MSFATRSGASGSKQQSTLNICIDLWYRSHALPKTMPRALGPRPPSTPPSATKPILSKAIPPTAKPMASRPQRKVPDDSSGAYSGAEQLAATVPAATAPDFAINLHSEEDEDYAPSEKGIKIIIDKCKLAAFRASTKQRTS